MAINYTDEDYTIKLYEKNSEQQEVQVAQKSIIETTSSTQQQVDALESFTYQDSISENAPYDHILYANQQLNPILTNANYSNNVFGYDSYISGNYAAVSVHLDSYNDTINNNKTGVMMLKSGSSGWESIQFLTVDNSQQPRDDNGYLSSIEHFGKAWSYDRKNGRHVVIAAPFMDSSEGGGYGLKGKVFIFTTSSTGFQHVQTITSASLPDSIKNHFQYIGSPDANGQEYSPGYHYWASSARVDGDHLSIGSLVRRNVPKTEWDNEDLYTNFTAGGANSTSPGVVMFKSSSSGFVFEKFLDGYDIEVDTTNESGYGLDNNLSHDLKDGVCIFAGNGGWAPGGWSSTNGRIRIWKTSSAEGGEWTNEGSIDLYSLGFTDDWSATIGPENFNLDNTMDNFPSWPEHSRPAFGFYYWFGRAGCAVSDDCIVATAQARTNDGYFDVNLSNRIFMIKSGSTGWVLEGNFASPNTAAQGDENNTFNDQFGRGGLAIDRGIVVVKAPSSKEDHNTDTGTQAGRAYIYRSSSVSGWGLDSTIDNPFRGSNPYSLTQANSDRAKFGGAAGGTSGEYPLNGYYYKNLAPAVGGGEDSQHVIIPYPGISMDLNSSDTFGGIYLLQGSASFSQETITTVVTQSVEVVNYVSGTGPVPFRFSVNGVFNLNEQNSGDKSYATFIGDLGTKN